MDAMSAAVLSAVGWGVVGFVLSVGLYIGFVLTWGDGLIKTLDEKPGAEKGFVRALIFLVIGVFWTILWIWNVIVHLITIFQLALA